ncbi:hypothetical protein D3C81_1273450 [compost metagenome]
MLNGRDHFLKQGGGGFVSKVEIPQTFAIRVTVAQFRDAVYQFFNIRQSSQHDRNRCLVEEMVDPAADLFLWLRCFMINETVKLVQDNQLCLGDDQALDDHSGQGGATEAQ